MSLERLGHLLVSLTVLAVIYLMLIDSRSATVVEGESKAAELPALRERESASEAGVECDLLTDTAGETFFRDCR